MRCDDMIWYDWVYIHYKRDVYEWKKVWYYYFYDDIFMYFYAFVVHLKEMCNGWITVFFSTIMTVIQMRCDDMIWLRMYTQQNTCIWM